MHIRLLLKTLLIGLIILFITVKEPRTVHAAEDNPVEDINAVKKRYAQLELRVRTLEEVSSFTQRVLKADNESEFNFRHYLSKNLSQLFGRKHLGLEEEEETIAIIGMRVGINAASVAASVFGAGAIANAALGGLLDAGIQILDDAGNIALKAENRSSLKCFVVSSIGIPEHDMPEYNFFFTSFSEIDYISALITDEITKIYKDFIINIEPKSAMQLAKSVTNNIACFLKYHAEFDPEQRIKHVDPYAIINSVGQCYNVPARNRNVNFRWWIFHYNNTTPLNIINSRKKWYDIDILLGSRVKTPNDETHKSNENRFIMKRGRFERVGGLTYGSIPDKHDKLTTENGEVEVYRHLESAPDGFIRA